MTSARACFRSQSAPCLSSTRSPVIPGSSRSPANAAVPWPSASAIPANATFRAPWTSKSKVSSMKMKNLQSIQVSRWRKHAAMLLFALLSLSPAISAQKKEKLAKNYREWLEHDVVYIITKDERTRFLALATDEARDKFINDFWEIRNPVPGSEINTYK